MTIHIGQDLGTNSVAIALLDNQRINFYLSIFGESNSSKRSELKRSMKTTRRTKHRKDRLKYLFHKEFNVNFIPKSNIWGLRSIAISQAISLEELLAILIHLSKLRGPSYEICEKQKKSKNESKSKDEKEKEKEIEIINQAMKVQHEKLKELNLDTQGQLGNELINNKNESIRNKNLNDHKELIIPHRSIIAKELDLILSNQKVHHHCLTDSIIEKIKSIVLSQRKPTWDANTLRRCIIEDTDYPANKYSKEYQKYLIYEKLNNIRIQDMPLNEKDKHKILSKLQENKVNKKKNKVNKKILYELLNLDPNVKINIDDKFEIPFDWFQKNIESQYPIEWHKIINKIINKPFFKEYSENDFYNLINQKLKYIEEDKKQELVSLFMSIITCNNRGRLSTKALNNVLPYMEKGKNFVAACAEYRKNSGNQKYDSNYLSKSQEKILKRKGIDKKLKYNNNPVVKKTLVEFKSILRYINKYHKIYNEDNYLNLETSKQLPLSPTQKEKLKAKQENNKKINDFIKNTFPHISSSKNFHKAKLWVIQQGKCFYTDSIIDKNLLFSDCYEIDHLIPQSIYKDNSISNTVLCKSDSNRKKSNKFCHEYLNEKLLNKRINEYRVGRKFENQNIPPDNVKIKNIYMTNEKLEDEWLKNQLPSTSWINREVIKYNQSLLGINYNNIKKIPSYITNELRELWKLNDLLNEYTFQIGEENPKNKRITHYHHLIDAVIMASLTYKVNNKIILSYYKDYKFNKIDAIPLPWPSFVEDIRNELNKFVILQKNKKTIGTLHAFNPVKTINNYIYKEINISNLNKKQLLNFRRKGGSNDIYKESDYNLIINYLKDNNLWDKVKKMGDKSTDTLSKLGVQYILRDNQKWFKVKIRRTCNYFDKIQKNGITKFYEKENNFLAAIICLNGKFSIQTLSNLEFSRGEKIENALCTFRIGDCFKGIDPKENIERVFYVTKTDTKKICLVDHRDARSSKNRKEYSMTPSKYKKWQLKKIYPTYNGEYYNHKQR